MFLYNLYYYICVHPTYFSKLVKITLTFIFFPSLPGHDAFSSGRAQRSKHETPWSFIFGRLHLPTRHALHPRLAGLCLQPGYSGGFVCIFTHIYCFPMTVSWTDDVCLFFPTLSLISEITRSCLISYVQQYVHELCELSRDSIHASALIIVFFFDLDWSV